jgi:type IV pilus modification protein PilV
VRRRCRGFTLLESLIALLVLTLGLLGSAALLLQGLQGNAAAARQLAATNLARDLAERIRLNARDAASARAQRSGALPERGTRPVSRHGGRGLRAVRARHRPRRVRPSSDRGALA